MSEEGARAEVPLPVVVIVTLFEVDFLAPTIGLRVMPGRSFKAVIALGIDSGLDGVVLPFLCHVTTFLFAAIFPVIWDRRKL